MSLSIKRTRFIKISSVLSLAAIPVLALSVWVTQSPQLAQAATPPDSCFDFSAGVINNYYDHENDDNAAPACSI